MYIKNNEKADKIATKIALEKDPGLDFAIITYIRRRFK